MTRGHVRREVAAPARHGEVENRCVVNVVRGVYEGHVVAPCQLRVSPTRSIFFPPYNHPQLYVCTLRIQPGPTEVNICQRYRVWSKDVELRPN